MSGNNPIDLRQDRRQWLKTSATIVGASILPLPAIGPEAPQAPSAPARQPRPAEAKSAARFFTPNEHLLVEELSETILPADSHSGGAKAAKVADTVDHYLAETYDDGERVLWREGLRLLDLMSQHYSGKSFVDSTPEQRAAILKVISYNSKMTYLPEVLFFNALKETTVALYYTSKIGIHDELEYQGNRILENYVGCDDQGTRSS